MMISARRALLGLFSGLVLGVVGPNVALAAPAAAATAAPRLIASQPAQSARVAGPKTILLTFSDAMAPAQTMVSIVMTAMPGMDHHGEMLIRNFTPAWSNANRTLTLQLRQALPTGSYDVRWQGKSGSGQGGKGTISFEVR